VITASTITDEQIAAVCESLDMTRDEDVALYDLGTTATHAPLGSLRRANARAHFAEILNARAANKSDECSTCGAIHDDVDCFGEEVSK